MDNLLQQEIEKFVADNFLTQGREFTAFDVTADAQMARHRFVRPIVHAMFDEGRMSGYDRKTDTTLPGSPYTYFKVAQDEEDDITEDVVVTTTIAKLDAEGKVMRLRKAALTFLGVGPGDILDAYFDPIKDTLYVGEYLDEIVDLEGITKKTTAKVGSKYDARVNITSLGLVGETHEVVTVTLHEDDGDNLPYLTIDTSD